MVGFSFKEISNPLSLGELLQEQREKKGISISESAKATGVSVKYLQALEDCDYKKLPGEVYAKGFLKVYTKFLGLDYDETLKIYTCERKVYVKTKKDKTTDFNKPVEKISRVHLIVTPKIVRGLLIILLALACLSYLGFKVKAIVTPPMLIISRPADNLMTEQLFIEVVGQSEAETMIEINGQQVLADQEGNFSETIDLQTGVNVIEVKATKRHGTETKKYLQVVVEEVE